MRHNKRVDANHTALVAEFRELLPEASVCDLSGAGKGVPDLMVGLNNRNYLFEVKDPEKVPSKRKLTPAQVKFHGEWQGQVQVIHHANQMIAAIFADQNRLTEP